MKKVEKFLANLHDMTEKFINLLNLIKMRG